MLMPKEPACLHLRLLSTTKKNVLFYEIGFGIDLYLEWFKFSPSIRGVFAISDELVADDDPNSPWTGNIDFMKTSGIMINFTFQ